MLNEAKVLKRDSDLLCKNKRLKQQPLDIELFRVCRRLILVGYAAMPSVCRAA